jgi:hypothetical protein
MVDFSIIAAPLLLVGLGAIELASWFYVRQAASLALLEAGRAAITAHGNPDAIVVGLERALLPLYPAAGGRTAQQRLQDALTERAMRIQAAPWQIQILSPTPAAFHDFADPQLTAAQPGRLPTINNHYQQEQHQGHRAEGRPEGAGLRSGMSIFQANTIVLRLTWLHEPLIPGMKALIRMLAPEQGSYNQLAMARGGYLPIKRDIALIMQSHPVDWPARPDLKVVRADVAPMPAWRSNEPCTGLWCQKALPGAHDAQNGPIQGQDSAGSTPAPVAGWLVDGDAPGGSGGPATPDENGLPGVDDLAVNSNDPACGVVLCC